MSDSGSSLKTIAGLRHGLSAHGLLVENVLVLQNCRKYRRWWRCFMGSGEFEKVKSKIKLFGKLSER